MGCEVRRPVEYGHHIPPFLLKLHTGSMQSRSSLPLAQRAPKDFHYKKKLPSPLWRGQLCFPKTPITTYLLSIIIRAARLPISTAKFVPRSHG